MTTFTHNLKQRARQAGFVALGTVASAGAMANTTGTTETAINAAVEAGKGNYELVVAGIIGIAAVGVAVGLILGMMKRS